MQGKNCVQIVDFLHFTTFAGRQTFYLVDEAESKGKGANSVVNMVHHYFQYYGLGESDACIHFDNCCGQNKNNVVVQYAMWRVMTGKSELFYKETV